MTETITTDDKITIRHRQEDGKDRVEIYAPGAEHSFMYGEWPVEGEPIDSAVDSIFAGFDKAEELIEQEIFGEADMIAYSTVPGVIERLEEGDE